MPDKANLGEIGVSGLKQSGGIIEEEFLRELKGEKGVKVYREMSSNDPVVGAMIFAVDMIMRQASWRTEPSEEAPDDYERADYVEQCRNDMSQSWEDTISEILSFLIYGWSYFEQVFKLRKGPEEKDGKYRSKYTDGNIGWRKFGIRSQESLVSWSFDPNGGILGMTQRNEETRSEIFIPIEKALLFRTTVAKNNPEGKSILRNGYRPWYFKKKIEEIEGIGIERDLAGIPVVKAPPELFAPDATPDQLAALNMAKDVATRIRRDEQEGIVMPALYDAHGNPMWELKLLTTGGRRQFDTDRIVSRYDQRIAMSLLADFILLGHESVGSFALAQSKIDLFAQAINAYLNAIAGVFNQHAIPKLLLLNGMSAEAPPRIMHGGVDQIDLEKLGEYVFRLAQSNMPLFPDGDLERFLREQGGMPTTTLRARNTQDDVPVPLNPPDSGTDDSSDVDTGSTESPPAGGSTNDEPSQQELDATI